MNFPPIPDNLEDIDNASFTFDDLGFKIDGTKVVQTSVGATEIGVGTFTAVETT